MNAAAPPTDRQLRYLRTLASRTATTFLPPSTRREASREIDRLMALLRSHPADVEVDERSRPQDHAYATAVRPDEVVGFGSAARWRSQPPDPRSQRASSPKGPARVQLLHYRVSAGERVLIGERRGDRVRVSDVPAHGEGPHYPVEDFDSAEGLASLRALLMDYKARARDLDEIPMASSALLQMLNPSRSDV
jgi:hypothetical protein